MKIRTGFVSNSSSTSFAIIGLSMWEEDPIVVELKHKILPEGKDMYEVYDSYSAWTDLGDELAAYGSDGELSYIGMDVVERWKNGLTYKEALKTIKELIKKKYDIDIPEKMFDVYVDEVNSG